ncbi:MAG: hypothetical protein ACO3AG_07160 [Fluviibacter sp.]
MMVSSTGGTIVQVGKTTFHYAGEGSYSGRLAEEGVEAKAFEQVKRGRGRPRKDVGSAGKTFSSAGLDSVFKSRVPASMKRLPTRVFKAKV